ncbi:MAG: DUF2274 domain-containing protein [Zymomonas sp.]|nr:MAG: DUF2274 domain-containing protein [Zymomonas sp.]
MIQLKLAKLPDRAPLKLAIMVTPDLYQALQQYAALYAEAYGREESLSDLVPAILAEFLESDKAFARWCRDATRRPS